MNEHTEAPVTLEAGGQVALARRVGTDEIVVDRVIVLHFGDELRVDGVCVRVVSCVPDQGAHAPEAGPPRTHIVFRAIGPARE